jgi:hypothetical protein
VIAGGSSTYGILMTGWHANGADGEVADITITNSIVLATNVNSIGLDCAPNNGGGIDADIWESTIVGRERALRYAGGNGNRDQDSLDSFHSTFAAGDVDGGVNSTNDVILLDTFDAYCRVRMDRTVVKNGRGGINLDPGTIPIVSLVNSVITDQDEFGVRLDAGGNNSELLAATNCTFSNIRGVAVIWGENGTSTTLGGNFYYCVFAPGGSATNFVNEDSNRQLTLGGYTNAVYEYGTFYSTTNAAGLTYSLLNTTTNPVALAKIASSDGYHLQRGSPLADVYPVQALDPAKDIDGDSRPLPAGGKGDIGADEAFLPPQGTLVLVW